MLDLNGWTEDEIFNELAIEDDTPPYHCDMSFLAARLATLWEARQLNLQRIDELRREVAELQARVQP